MTSNVLAPAAPLTWSDLERRLAGAAADGLVPNDSVPGLRSTLRSALLSLVRQRNRLAEESVADVLEAIDLTAYLPHAAEAAKLRAKAAGHVRPGNAAARVSQALRLALPETFGGEALTAKQKAALRGPGWQPLFAAVESLPHARVHHRYLVILADALWADGGDGPTHLPPTADEGAALLRQAGRNETEVAKAVHAYRKTLEALAADGLLIPGAPTWKEPRTARLGIRRIGGAAGDAEETLKRELPAFYDLLQEWRSGPADALRPRSRRSSEGALLRVAGLLVRMHAAGALPIPSLQDVHPLHLWQLRVRSPRQDVSASPTDTARVARLLTPLLGAGGAVAAARSAAELPLAAAAGEWAVIHKVVKRRMAKASKFALSEGLVYDFGRVWHMVRGVAEPPIRTAENKGQIEQFERLAAVVAAVEQHFAKLYAAAGEPTVKDKVRAIEHCTLPIMTCLVLPWWTMVELPRRRAAVAEYAASRGGATKRRSTYDRRTERSLGNNYETALESWALQAVMTADPLRRAQAVYGRLGREYELEAEWNADGSLARVLRVGSRFHGQGWEDNPAASLKQRHLGLREWQLSPSVLALAWLAEYLERVWLARLRRRGLIDSECSLREAVESGRFALFVSGDAAGSNPTYGYCETYMSQRFAKALVVSLQALGHGVPECKEAAKQGWALILGPHVLRLYWATYWLGLREHVPLQVALADGSPYKLSGVEIAKSATTDSERTLRRDYVEVSEKTRQMEREADGTWRHPRAYDALMDRAYMVSERIDWRALWSSPGFLMPDAMRAEFARATASGAMPGRCRRRRRATTAPAA